MLGAARVLVARQANRSERDQQRRLVFLVGAGAAGVIVRGRRT
jgi:hypothetical protein